MPSTTSPCPLAQNWSATSAGWFVEANLPVSIARPAAATRRPNDWSATLTDVEFDRGIEHDAEQVGVRNGVLHVGDAERGQVAHRVGVRCDKGSPFSEPAESFLAHGTPQPLHAVEVGVHRHRGQSGAGHQ